MGDNELPYVLAVAHVVVPAVRLEFLHLLFGDPDVDRLRQISSRFSSHCNALLNFIEIVILYDFSDKLPPSQADAAHLRGNN